MPKPSKSSSEEFLSNRRKAIAEMAHKRRQQQLLRASGLAAQENAPKVSAPIPFPGSPRVTQS